MLDRIVVKLAFVLCVTLLPADALCELAAFPGAKGFGQNAVGGRGGDVYIVTNLDDSGPGSFRDAVSKSHRTVVFAVGGVINIKSRIIVEDHITIAGQTAPGDGVAIYGNGISFSGADHAIVRYMRFRMGANGSKGKDAITIAEGSPMIFDHVSASWGRDETFSISGKDGFFTIQNSIISQGLHSHSCGGLIQNWGGVSILRCLYIDNHTRNPKVKGVNQFVNNVIYNWRVAGYILGGGSSAESHANVVGNYFISGPDTGNKPAFTRANANFHIFAKDNYHDRNPNGSLDGDLIEQGAYGPVTWQDKRFDYPVIGRIYSPETSYKLAVSECGASMPKRDEVDSLLIEELTSLGKKGQIIANENELETKGPGELKGGLALQDTDQDGMPDYWEKSIAGLDYKVKDNNGDVNKNGYTNLEDYLNWLGAAHVDVVTGGKAKVDLRGYTQGFSNKAKYGIAKQTLALDMQDDGESVVFDADGVEPGVYEVKYVVDDEGDIVAGEVYVLVTTEDKKLRDSSDIYVKDYTK